MAFQCFPKLRALHLNLCNSATIKILEGLIKNGLAKNMTILDIQVSWLVNLEAEKAMILEDYQALFMPDPVFGKSGYRLTDRRTDIPSY